MFIRNLRILLALCFSNSLFGMTLLQVRPPLDFKFGLSERQGRRPEMEDRFNVVLGLDGDSQHAFFAIYDGHAGVEVAEFVAQNLAMYYLAAFRARSAVDQALYEAFIALDQEVLKRFEMSGCTALVAVVYHGQLYFAWAGDSRGIFVSPDVQKGTFSYQTTIDHEPSNNYEIERVYAAGGFMAADRYGVVRTNGLIMPTRGFGDKVVKEMNGAYIADPQIFGPFPVKKGDFLILSCDGVWEEFKGNEGTIKVIQYVTDVFLGSPILLEEIRRYHSDQPVNEIVTEEGNSDRALLAARRVRDIAYNAGSTDNISTMVIAIEEKVAEPEQPGKKVELMAQLSNLSELLSSVEDLHNIVEDSLLSMKKEPYSRALLTRVEQMLQSISNAESYEGVSDFAKSAHDSLEQFVSGELYRMK